MASIGGAFKHIFRPDSKDPVLTPVKQQIINANIDANRNTLFGRAFDDDKGLGGSEHFSKIQDRRATRQKDKEVYENQMKQHRESLENLTTLRADAQANGLGDDALASFDKGIKATNEAMRNTKRQTSLVSDAWDNTADTWRAMNSGTAGQIATKWGTVAAAGAVINGTGRALTGGGVTYNASGERDIMGIPFV